MKKKPSVQRIISNLQWRDIWKREPKPRFKNAKLRAKSRGVKFSLKFSEYSKIVSLPCTYCGELKHEMGVGLDRIDNAKGYEFGNVVPCCFVCNMLKGNFCSVFFRQAARKIKG